jgi:hypothetical protein
VSSDNGQVNGFIEDIEMLMRYIKAYRNDLEYIKELIKNDPKSIDEGCPDDYPYWEESRLSWIATIECAEDIGIGSVGGVAARVACSTHLFVSQLLRTNSYKNRTMLDFAAEGGATEVAVYLIQLGATISNIFSSIAIKNGHGGRFLDTCNQVRDAQADLQRHKNDNQALKQKNNQLESDNELLKKDNQVITDKYKSLLSKNIIMLKANPQLATPVQQAQKNNP